MSNAYDPTRGNTTDRARRKQWLLDTYAADRVLVLEEHVQRPYGVRADSAWMYEGPGVTILPCCRCYRCGKLLTIETVTVDRIVPGHLGGTYRRSNIRPSCSDCANKQGGEIQRDKKKARRESVR